jgi:hypothetical protein
MSHGGSPRQGLEDQRLIPEWGLSPGIQPARAARYRLDGSGNLDPGRSPLSKKSFGDVAFLSKKN